MTTAFRTRFATLRRSLTAQLVAFTLLVLILALIFYVLIPLRQMEWIRDPLVMTHTLAGRALNEAADSDLQVAAHSGDLAAIAMSNPDFYYYVRRGDRDLQFGNPPRLIDTVDLFVPVSAESEASENLMDCESYSLWNTQFTENGRTTRLAYRQCNGQETYYEYGGIEVPVERAVELIFGRDLRMFWLQSRELLMAALAFVIIAVAVQWMAVRSLRRVTHVAQSLDPGTGRRALLPEKGIPAEATPLVRAVNDLIRRLRESQEQQGLFLAAAAHEMRTPLAVIRTRLEELPDSAAKGELREDVRRIVSLVEQLLRLAIIRNRDELSGDVDLVDVARTVVAQRAPLSLDKGVEIEVEAEPGAVPVRGDGTLVEVAVANLLDNAVSFSPPGERVTVRVAAPGTVTVRDRGPGLAEGVRESVFEPFSKSPPNRDGHGLGLAIVKAVMDLHGGGVSVSRPRPDPPAVGNYGAGTAFGLSFPGGDGENEKKVDIHPGTRIRTRATELPPMST